MPFTARGTIGAFDFTGGSAFQLRQLSQASFDPAIQTVMNYAAGQANPSYVGVISQAPMLAATTTEIARFLSNVSQNGLAVVSTGGVTGLDCYLTYMPNLGIRGGAGTHIKIGGITKALVVPKQLTANQDAEATLSFDVCLISNDGVTYPWTFTASVSLPTTNYADEKFTLGPVNINGAAVSGVRGLTYDFGLKIDAKRDSGNPFPIYVITQTQEPKLSIKTEDPNNLNTFGPSGVAQGVTASTFYLRKLLKGSMRTPDATAEHIKITMNASQGMIIPAALSGSNNSDLSIDLTAMPIVGASAILTISAASAIT